jgi:hypothetical protein
MNDRGLLYRPGFARSAICLALYVLVPAGSAQAQSSGGSYTLRKHVIGAGVTAQGSPYRIVATSGQAPAGSASGGGYFVTAGFHQPRLSGLRDLIFCNGFENTACNLPTGAPQ